MQQQHSHHAPQGPPQPSHQQQQQHQHQHHNQHLQQHSRPSSIVNPQQPPAPAAQQQHQAPYQSSHGLPQYAPSAPDSAQQHAPGLPYYPHPSPYSTPSASGNYSSAETPEIMAAAQMSRPYPPISYHTPQSNSPASVASPSAHDQHGRNMYGQPGPQMQQQPMYYPPQQQYSPMPPQGGPSPYGQHAPPQHHQSMASQPNLLMSHQAGQHQMQHPAAAQHQQSSMTSSPRPKMEHGVPQIQRPPPGNLVPPHHQQNGPPMNQGNVGGPGGVNPNAAPGPIPATTPLVVRQDNNGVQWIAFEYSRDRVKMEYTIRCDVESVNVETLTSEFKTENCVYPRACCSKDQYRGNRLVYETECNTVGWALAELNPCLRGKRGLIQRAVDSWRNSNQDPRLRSRRVRRMAKMSTRKTSQGVAHQQPHMGAPGAPGMPAGGAPSMGKPGIPNMGQNIHHHHAHPEQTTQGGGDDVGNAEYSDGHHTHHHAAPNGQATNGEDIRPVQVFSGYPGQYPPPPNVGSAAMPPQMQDAMGQMPHGSSIVARSKSNEDSDGSASLFGDIPEGKRRKFILVDDPVKQARVRVRVTLDTVNLKEMPDSFRKSNSVFPHSYFPTEMQSPSAHAGRFFDDEDDDVVQTNPGRRYRGRTIVKVPMASGADEDLGVPKKRKSQRAKEVKLNDLAYRMTWHQSRVFAGRPVFLQKALDQYRNKNRATIESMGQEVSTVAPHFETRVGKRIFERSRQAKRDAEQ